MRKLSISPRSLALASLVLVTATMTVAAAVLNNGAIVYVLDDAYIHLAIARNLIEHGTYGIEPGVFAGASSSPGWVLLLAGIGSIAPAALDLAPLALGFASAAMAVVLLSRPAHGRTFEKCGAAAHALWAALPLLLFLPSLILTGMEHALHAALVLLVADQWLTLLTALTSDARPSSRTVAGMGLLMAAATTIRYESAFVVVGLVLGLILFAWATSPGLWVAVRRIALPVAALTIPSAVAIGVMGYVHATYGHHPLPNPLLLKTALADGAGIRALFPNLWLASWNLRHDAIVGGLFATFSWVLFWSRARRWSLAAAIATAWLGAALLHASYGSFFGFGRYQAYLVVLGAFLLLHLASRAQVSWSPLQGLGVLMTIALLFAVSDRTPETVYTPLASNNIHEQQAQMARFMATENAGVPVAVNDLGLMAFRHSGPVIDLVGLGTNEVLLARQQGRFTETFMQEIATRRGVEIAIVYDDWIRAPNTWIKVAEWRLLRRRITPASDTVAFYATSPESAPRLLQRMTNFQSTLPPTVEVRIFHPDEKASPSRRQGG